MAKKSKKEQKAERNKKSNANPNTRRPKQKGKVTKQVAQRNSTFTYETQQDMVQKKVDELMAMDPNRCIHNARSIAKSWAKLQMRKAKPSTQGQFTTNKFGGLKKALRLEA